MDRAYFMALADTFRSPHLWKKEGEQWKLRHQVTNLEKTKAEYLDLETV
jgi:hypothetical protein